MVRFCLVVVEVVVLVGLSLILLMEYVVLWLDCDGVVWLLSICWKPKGLPCPIGGPGWIVVGVVWLLSDC